MPRPAGSKNYSREEQRAIALAALRGVPTAEITAAHGVTRHTVYRLRDEALADPKGALAEAEEELEFRRSVLGKVSGKS